jgi:hypothetical protein
MYLAPIAQTVIALGPRITGQAIGINAADPRQWGEVDAVLEEKAGDGQRGLGDLRDHDARFSQACFNQGAAPVVVGIAKRKGWSAKYLRRLREIIYRYPMCVLVVDAFALWLWSTMLSGVMSTDFLNGVVVWLLLCMCFLLIVGASFRRHAAAVCLGDDHVLATRPEYREAYNASSIAALLLLWGHVYTTAQKDLDFKNFWVDRSRATFLQRVWVLRGQGYTSPMELKRVFRCLYLMQPSSHVEMAAQVASMVHNVARECFLHGEELYTRFCAAIPESLPMPDGSVFSRPLLPTFAELNMVWWGGKLTTWDAGGQWAEEAAPAEVAVQQCTSAWEPLMISPIFYLATLGLAQIIVGTALHVCRRVSQHCTDPFLDGFLLVVVFVSLAAAELLRHLRDEELRHKYSAVLPAKIGQDTVPTSGLEEEGIDLVLYCATFGHIAGRIAASASGQEEWARVH